MLPHDGQWVASWRVLLARVAAKRRYKFKPRPSSSSTLKELSSMTRFTIPMLVLVGMLTTAASHAQDDQIFGKNGAPTRGQITAISPNQVKIKSPGAELTF